MKDDKWKRKERMIVPNKLICERNCAKKILFDKLKVSIIMLVVPSLSRLFISYQRIVY